VVEEKEKHLTEEETSEGLESTETLDSSTVTGSVKISEEVIAQIATQALLSVKGVQPASPGLVANLRLGKKSSSGVKISVHDGEVPSIAVEAYVTVKYGLRIPDVAWDVQESIKKNLEQFTGYTVKSVDVYVQGVFFESPQKEEETAQSSAETEGTSPPERSEL
jgi:uncharacterized alkaline shock family protein YloU